MLNKQSKLSHVSDELKDILNYEYMALKRFPYKKDVSTYGKSQKKCCKELVPTVKSFFHRTRTILIENWDGNISSSTDDGCFEACIKATAVTARDIIFLTKRRKQPLLIEEINSVKELFNVLEALQDEILNNLNHLEEKHLLSKTHLFHILVDTPTESESGKLKLYMDFNGLLKTFNSVNSEFEQMYKACLSINKHTWEIFYKFLYNFEIIPENERVDVLLDMLRCKINIESFY